MDDYAAVAGRLRFEIVVLDISSSIIARKEVEWVGGGWEFAFGVEGAGALCPQGAIAAYSRMCLRRLGVRKRAHRSPALVAALVATT